LQFTFYLKLLVVEQLIRLAVLVMVTEYFPGLSTTIEADVSPVDHEICIKTISSITSYSAVFTNEQDCK
jgi:hypothetical protein